MAVLYETPRLRVRTLEPADAHALYELHRHAAVMDWLKSPVSTAPDEERARIDGWRARGYAHGYGFHALLERDPERLHPDVWGRGYATEVARGAIAFAVSSLGLAERDIAAVTLPDNTRSRAVMERLGMTYAGEVEHAGLPHVLYLLAPG